MRIASPWHPRLADIAAPPSERLVAALADDIIEGRLEAGARLPAHRDLAWRLGIGIGTVTKAYGVLERRGLTRSVKGHGTFMAAIAARNCPVIDLSINTPPAMLSERVLAKTLIAAARNLDPHLFTLYPPAAGHDEHRRLMSRWLAPLGMEADASRLLLTNGAQQALSVAFGVACGPGGTILTEALTYPGAIALARHAGYRLRRLTIDGEGIVPEALEAALATCDRTPIGLYVTPTMHNPTTATMSEARRGRS
ncbi:PLP-dependent aminotransferase family protein [Chelatococcus albus]|uniref:aminotransferase-like domain-containing protein n=1 Tax=Chelatococcus albus TaxID=3047466 RepID=UPI0030ED6C53